MPKDRQSFHLLTANIVIAFGVVGCASGLVAIFLSWIACLGIHLNMLVVRLVMLVVSTTVSNGGKIKSCNDISIAISYFIAHEKVSLFYLVTGVSALSSSETSNWTTLGPITTTSITLAPTITSSSTQVYRSKLMDQEAPQPYPLSLPHILILYFILHFSSFSLTLEENP